MKDDFEFVEETLNQLSRTFNDLDAEVNVKEDSATYSWETEEDRIRKISLRAEYDHLEVNCYELCGHGAQSIKTGKAPLHRNSLYKVLKEEYMREMEDL